MNAVHKLAAFAFAIRMTASPVLAEDSSTMDMSCMAGAACPFSYGDTCDPAGKNTGGSAVELIQSLNCSVWTQGTSSWPASAYGGLGYNNWTANELPALGFDQTTETGYLFVNNPAGVRETTMSGQCFWTTPGCDPSSAAVTGSDGNMGVYSAMELLASTAENYVPFYLMSRACSVWGGCTGTACDENGSPVKGSVKLYQNLKCAVLQWTYPLPQNVASLPILTDPVGNKYVMHAYDQALGYADPDPDNYPDGWTIGYMDFSTPEAESFTIFPFNPSGYCDEGAVSTH